MVRQLAARAGAIAQAAAETRALEQRKDPTRWRRAKLLWPLFAKD
jgi:energy-coupling factor transporter transmembrane protein EcfT